MSYSPALEIRRRLLGSDYVNRKAHPAIKEARAALAALYIRKQGHVYDESAVRAACRAFDQAMKAEGLSLGASAPLRG